MSKEDRLMPNVFSLLYYFQGGSSSCSCRLGKKISKDQFYHLISFFDIINIRMESSEIFNKYSFHISQCYIEIADGSFDINSMGVIQCQKIPSPCFGYYVDNHGRFDFERNWRNLYYKTFSIIWGNDDRVNNDNLLTRFPLIDFRFLIGISKLFVKQTLRTRVVNHVVVTYLYNLFTNLNLQFAAGNGFQNNHMTYINNIVANEAFVLGWTREKFILEWAKIAENLWEEYDKKKTYIDKIEKLLHSMMQPPDMVNWNDVDHFLHSRQYQTSPCPKPEAL